MDQSEKSVQNAPGASFSAEWARYRAAYGPAYLPISLGGPYARNSVHNGASFLSPFEFVRDAELVLAWRATIRPRDLAAHDAALRPLPLSTKDEALQAKHYAQLLAWAKDKGLVAADAIELPSFEQQLLSIKQAGFLIG